MKIRLYKACDTHFDGEAIDPNSLKTFEDWNKVDVIIVYDDEAYYWLKEQGEKLNMYTPCDYYTKEQIVRHSEYIHSDVFDIKDFSWVNDRWWLDASEATYKCDDDRYFYDNIRECP